MRTIRQRLTWRLLAAEAVLLLIGATLAFAVMRDALTRQFDEALRTKLMALAAAVEEDNGRLNFESGEQLPGQFDAASPTLYFQIWDSEGHEAARSKVLRQELMLPPYRATTEPQVRDLRLDDGLATRVASLSFHPVLAGSTNDAASQKAAIAVVAADRSDLDSRLVSVATVMAGSCLVVLILTAVVVPWVLRRELAPLDHLATQVQGFNADSLTGRFSIDGMPGELIPVCHRLNDLMSRLQAAFVRERQFSDDLAHEFRTPIAELRALAEVSLKWPSNGNQENDQEVLAIALQMEGMINRLLVIARGGHGRNSAEMQTVDLAGLITTIWKPLEPSATRRSLSSRFEIPSKLEIRSDPVLLRSILVNLLDNAVDHAAPGGTVRIRATVENNRFTVDITNPVLGLESADLPRLFERFWRKDPARSGNNHSGLGLPLARAFAACIDCTLAASLGNERLLTLTLTGPANLTSNLEPRELSQSI